MSHCWEDSKTTVMVHDNLKMERSPLDRKLLARARNGVSNEPLEHILHSTKEDYGEVLVNTNHYVFGHNMPTQFWKHATHESNNK